MLLSKRTATLISTQAVILFLAGQQCRAEAQTQQPAATPSAAVSMYNLGLKAYKEGTPESAIIFFTRACDINPDLADAQYNLGVLYQSQKRCREAIPRFQEVIRVKPMDPDAHYQLALCCIDMGQTAEARTHLGTIAPNNPHFADAQKRLAMLDGQPGTAASVQQIQQVQPVQQVQPAPQQTYVAPQAVQTPPATTYAQPPAYQTPQYTQQPPAAPATVTPPAPHPQPNLNAPKAYGTQSGGPTAVLANCTVRVIATGFSAPAGLAFDKQGNLYVANFMSSTVDRVNVDGSRSQFSSGANLKGPIGLVVDGSNSLYVANYLSGTVARISPSGVSTIIATGFKKPYYLTLDKDGNLFVSQQEDNTVVRVTLPKAAGAKPM
jgi:thioredoxin-like negative regulator of GroEL